ncbi:hypothetical protein F5148DRAFT_983903, partial [Russula earlei]
ALHIAAIAGNPKVAEVLLKYGPDLHAQDDDGLTPLRLAMMYKHAQIVRLLSEHAEKVVWRVRSWDHPSE